MKKNASGIILFAVFWIFSGFSLSASKSKHQEKKRVIYGIAQESKAGLVVEGIMITSLTADDIKKFSGKRVKAKGIIRKRKENPDKYSQDFTMPEMIKLEWIRIED